MFHRSVPLLVSVDRASHRFVKILRIVGILLGGTLIAVLIKQVGWGPIRETLTLLGWKYIVVLLYPLTWMGLNTIGWYYACHPKITGLQLIDLFAIRTAGETFNSLLPSSYVGGEPIKAQLLSRWMPLREAASSVLIAKSAQSIGLLFFIGLGLLVGLPVTSAFEHRNKVWIALAVLTLGVGTFTYFLAHQSFSRLGKALHRFTKWPWLQAQEKRLLALDDSLGNFYRECKGRFLASAGWHGLGWITGMFELVVIFKLMVHSISWQQGWFMGALAQLGSVIGLISPGGLGFYEGGHYMAAVLLGLPPELGISASLIRRVREIFWSLVGLYFFGRYSKETAKPAQEPLSAAPGR
jgi:uncharacterized protein (TIRG00374 family)